MHVVLQVAGVDHGEDVGHVQVVRVPGEVNLRSSNINISSVLQPRWSQEAALTQLISV